VYQPRGVGLIHPRRRAEYCLLYTRQRLSAQEFAANGMPNNRVILARRIHSDGSGFNRRHRRLEHHSPTSEGDHPMLNR
jgi:hypothetical protein